MTTVNAIATSAFTAVAAAITDAVKSCTLSRITQGAYNPSTGAYAETTSTDTGRCVEDTQSALQDRFPQWTIGPTDKLYWVEGLDTLAPKEGDTLTVDSVGRTVLAVGDVVGAGGLYAVIANG